MLVSAVIPMMSLYQLPHGQYGYKGHIVNLPQDVASFARSLPRLPQDLDVLIIRKEGAAQTHRDFRVHRSRVLNALQWLIANNAYYRHIQLHQEALSLLPEDGDISNLSSVTVNSPTEVVPEQTHKTEDPYNAHLSQTCPPQLPKSN